MAITKRNLRSGTGLGLSVFSGVASGLDKGVGRLTSFVQNKEERERKKPFEDLQIKNLTQQTNRVDRENKEREEIQSGQESMKDFIRSKFPNIDEDTLNKVSDLAEKSEVKNSTIQDALNDPELLSATEDPEKAGAYLKKIGALDETETGNRIRGRATPEAQEYLNNIIAETKKPIDDLGVKTADEIEAVGNVEQPGKPAREAPTTSVFRPDDTGELARVEPEPPEEELTTQADEEPDNVKRAREIMDELIRTGSINDPMFKNTAIEMKGIVDGYESGKAAGAQADEKERIRLDEQGFKKREREDAEEFKKDQQARLIKANKENVATAAIYRMQAAKAKEAFDRQTAEEKRKNPLRRTSTTTQSKMLTETGAALVRFKQLRNMLANNEAVFFDRIPLIGSFKNKELEGVMTYLKNRLGRKDSGAAISAKEWRVFEKLILDTKTLTSQKGLQVAIDKIDDHIGDFSVFGQELSQGNKDWFKEYEKNAKEGVKNVVGDGGDATEEELELAEMQAQLDALDEEDN